MGILTRLYNINGELAINIPSDALPPSQMQLVEERVEVPGYEAQTNTWYESVIRVYKNRTAVLLTPNIDISPAESMSRLGLDPDKPIYVKPYGADIWIKAHLYHGYHGRVWIPTAVARRTGMRGYDVYPFIIKGTTYPKVEIRYIRKEVRAVFVEHMGKTYSTDNYATNRWRWIIPKEIDSYPVLMNSISMNIYPEAQCHLTALKDVIQIDFLFTSASGKIVSEKIGYAFRNMAVRNYTATVDTDYPFLCEIRATYLTCTPKNFYQPDLMHHTILKEALQITIYNLLEHFFTRLENKDTGDELPYSTMSYADHIDKIDFSTNHVNMGKAYRNLPVDEPWKNNYLAYTAEGEGMPSEETFNMEKRFYYCIKYVRVLNESSYQDGQIDRWVYNNERIETIIMGKQRNKIIAGKRPSVEIDSNGFIWRL